MVSAGAGKDRKRLYTAFSGALTLAKCMDEDATTSGVQVKTLQCHTGVPTYYLAKFTGTPGSYNSYNVSTMSHL
jgi:hypothetical protein